MGIISLFYYFIYMQLINRIILLVLVLSLCIQSVSLAAMGFSIRVYGDFDDIMPPSAGSPTAMQNNIGNITYILIAASISCLLYIYLILSRLLGKNVSQFFDWICYFSIVFFQFAIAVVFSINLTNNRIDYETLQNTLQTARNAGISSPLVDTLSRYVTVHNLQVAAAVLTFVFGFFGGVFLFIRDTIDKKNQASVNTGNIDKVRSQLEINEITGV